MTAPVSNEPFGEIQEARWLDPTSPPLGRLVFLGDVGVDAGGGWGGCSAMAIDAVSPVDLIPPTVMYLFSRERI